MTLCHKNRYLTARHHATISIAILQHETLSQKIAILHHGSDGTLPFNTIT